MALRPILLSLALLCLALVAPGMAGAQTFPKLTGRVVDDAHLLNPAQEQALDGKLAALEKDTGRQVVVATLPDLQGRDIADYGYRLGRAWGIGSKEKNDGALLIVAPNERRVRIEVGYGLEGVLTDATSTLIIANDITPHFKQGDFPGGINAGVDQIGALLKLTPEEAKARAATMEAQARKNQQEGGSFTIVVVMGFIVLFMILRIFSRRSGGQAFRGGAGGIPPVILWGPGIGGRDDDDRWGGGGGFGGFGGGGGGGFSGGGGSFGGGGASGGW
ncbi:MAG TPA: TPM domain-containing protein [Sphingobium sp.]|uniref:TPM domain-containing protein n=1 Tax=Sphingobium sp. TaxID=1912891 RepID=UPI002ED52A06